MAVDREQWAEKFEAIPHWQCPTCGKGHLLPLKDKIWFEETGLSKVAHSHDAWEPDWILNRFAGFIQCNMPACGDVVSISGTSPSDFVEYHDDHQHIQELKNLFVVRSIDPSPIPIHLPTAVPGPILEAIKVGTSINPLI